MNALFLKDLADKTRRGRRGRVEQGRSGGGLCYGYDIVRETDSNGEPVRGGRSMRPKLKSSGVSSGNSAKAPVPGPLPSA